ncbi:MAG TPA: hypothetical protein VEC16_05865 [Alphaproteobacteria bacterium]|nr:hypothetical protein [Alphaproteobacteria bacterium]
MSLDMKGLEDYAYDILITRKKYELDAKIKWLKGFNAIIKDSLLNFETFENVIKYSSSRANITPRPPFTRFQNAYKKRIEDEVLIPAAIALNDDFHISFWVEKLSGENDDYCKIFCCKEYYGGEYHSNYPSIDMRLNFVPHENNELSLYVKFDGEMTRTYDTFLKATPDLLINSYIQMDYIIERSKVPTMGSIKEKNPEK